jgi:DNA-3-methyladenine glycosylase II
MRRGSIWRSIVGLGAKESITSMSDSMSGASTDTDTLTLTAHAPFDLPLTVAILRRRPTNSVDTYAAGEYRRLLRVGAHERLIAVRQISLASVEVSALDGTLSQMERSELTALLHRMLGLTRDMTPVIEAFGRHEPLAHLVARLSGMKPTRYPDLWTTLVGVVPYQL